MTVWTDKAQQSQQLYTRVSRRKKKDITLMHPHVSKAQSLMVDFHGQLNTYSAGKESSNLTRCKKFFTDLQLCHASYSLYTALQHKGEPCSFLESNSYLQLSGVKLSFPRCKTWIKSIAITILLELSQSISKLESKQIAIKDKTYLIQTHKKFLWSS